MVTMINQMHGVIKGWPVPLRYAVPCHASCVCKTGVRTRAFLAPGLSNSSGSSSDGTQKQTEEEIGAGTEKAAAVSPAKKTEFEDGAPKLSRRESEKRNFDASQKLAAKEGRAMTREETLGLGSASTEDTTRRLNEMTFNFSFGGN